ncbi:MAG: hypothetical protein ACXAC7_10660 [Candidatus Hodarchaeales archaeon]|jgi:hypothetical protein
MVKKIRLIPILIFLLVFSVQFYSVNAIEYKGTKLLDINNIYVTSEDAAAYHGVKNNVNWLLYYGDVLRTLNFTFSIESIREDIEYVFELVFYSCGNDGYPWAEFPGDSSRWDFSKTAENYNYPNSSYLKNGDIIRYISGGISSDRSLTQNLIVFSIRPIHDPEVNTTSWYTNPDIRINLTMSIEGTMIAEPESLFTFTGLTFFPRAPVIFEKMGCPTMSNTENNPKINWSIFGTIVSSFLIGVNVILKRKEKL